ncbi:MAG: alpha/beta hydrolase [Deltaproteobacteria bacterium]
MPSLVSQDIPGPAGRLEALLDLPDGPPRAAALLCHPHPLGGGTMHTHAVFRAMRALRSQGAAVLRFGFRGVGRSEGRHDGGPGERDDARAATAALRERLPGLPLVVAGFSFGAWVASAVGPALGDALLLLGPPVGLYPFAELRAARGPRPLPTAVVVAERDEYAPLAAVEALVQELPPPARLWQVPGASHLFTERLDAYEAAVGQAVAWLFEHGS